jgi:hypothetical protein
MGLLSEPKIPAKYHEIEPLQIGNGGAAPTVIREAVHYRGVSI